MGDLQRIPIYWLVVACALSGLLTALDCGLGFALVSGGRFNSLDAASLLEFVPSHMFIWRLFCGFAGLASLSFLLFLFAYAQVLSTGSGTAVRFALAIGVIAAAFSIDSNFELMVLFSDLALELGNNYSYLQGGLVQLAFAAVNGALTKQVLLANFLNSLATLILVLSSFKEPEFPRLIAWLGLPLSLLGLNCSLLLGSGFVELALLAYLAVKILFVFWASFVGLSFYYILGLPKAQSKELRL